MFALLIGLLDTPAFQKQVVIVDGRVADGCAMWMKCRTLLTTMDSDNFTQQSMFHSQATQGGQSSSEKFVDSLIKMANKYKTSENVPEGIKRSLVKNYSILKPEDKLNRIKKFLTEMTRADRGSKLYEFLHAWFSLSSAVEDSDEKDQHCVNMMIASVEIVMKRSIAVPHFFGMFNEFNIQISKLPNQYLMQLVGFVRKMLEDSLNFEADTENSEVKPFNQRWKDYVHSIIRRVSEIDDLEYNEMNLPGAEIARNVLFDWMRYVKNSTAFELLVEIACDYQFGIEAMQQLCDEVIVHEIWAVNSGQDQELVEMQNFDRKLNTSKALFLTVHLDKERSNQLWTTVLKAWWHNSDDERVSNELTECLEVAFNVVSHSVQAAMRFNSFLKNEKSLVFCSDFGFALAILQCCLDRNDCMSEMKQSIQKLWRFGEIAEECVWMAENVSDRFLPIVSSQMQNLANSMAENRTARRLLSKPMFALLIGLLDTPAYQKQVVIVDGRVADGCAMWMKCRTLLTTICCAQDNMEEQLSLLFKAIAMRRDIAVSLIRCLQPIINTRPQLRTALFKSLKKDLLNETTVCSAVPIVLMLLRSVSKRKDGGGGQFDHSMSQSFGSFSTQSLDLMGCKKNIDQSVGLELIGIVKSCLFQPVHTKIALYDGICELATQTSTMLNQFLDMLIAHTKNAPALCRTFYITSSKESTNLVEPLPHLIQTVECLMGELVAFDPNFQTEGTELLLKQAVNQMEEWVLMATRNDMTDLGFDRNIEWNAPNSNAKSNVLFAQMMLSVYDVLIEHMWRRVEAIEKKEDADKLVALLNRRKELDKAYEPMGITFNTCFIGFEGENKREIQFKTPLDTSQTEILTSAKTLASIMSKFDENADKTANHSTINVRPEILADVQMELLFWTVSRCKVLSLALIKEYRPLHTIVSGTDSLLSLQKSLFDFYVSIDVPSWIDDIPTGAFVKTMAIESYANILQFLSVKYKMMPMRVAAMWFEEKEDEDEESRKKRYEANILILRHAHLLSCKLFKQILKVENEDTEEEKPPKMAFENQGKAILKAANSALAMSKNVKVWANIFRRAIRVLETEQFYNNQMLRDFVKFVTNCAMRSQDENDEVFDEMNAVMENILEFLSEENDEIRYSFITKTSLNVATEFVFGFVEKSMNHLKESFQFLKQFCVKPSIFEEICEILIKKCLQITILVSRILQIFVQYKLMQEKITQLLTSFFAMLGMPVDLLESLSKPWGKEMKSWKCVDLLAGLVKTKLSPILAMVDDHIGFSKGKDELKKRISDKTRLQQSKRDEKLYVKFSEVRERIQAKILVLCKSIGDQRFDIQIRNNSIGCRDFRIDMDVIRSKIGGEEVEQGSVSKRRRVADDEHEQTEEPEEEEEEHVREEQRTTAEVKMETDDDDECSRGVSPVF
ncbi:unnamed protein product [Caenorhabditis bovis]|uniref:FANCI helical domain-containing protein n=1 Tax=Caenorhabditis bovis TaxID=2654633 RepID=A0A8S1EXY0_9PELO|nr:unnamed protein product [Caenorhabditis bovis]